MRFLNVKTLKIHSFDDASVYPPYAILSHRWYSSELELTFKDFEDLSQHTSKPGYSKIVSACQATVAQGYEWLWADNVCINGEDTVEKAETVKKLHSMFSEAGVCLLYLSEIPNANIKDDYKEILSSDIQKSGWMNRVWTYQELIAPHKPVFYAADWSLLDPESQAEIITKILGVNQHDESKDDKKQSQFPSEGLTGAGSLSSFPSLSSAQSVDEEGPSVFEGHNQPPGSPYRQKIENTFSRLSKMIGTPAQDSITEPKVKRVDRVDLPMIPGEQYRTLVISAVEIERDQQERANVFDVNRGPSDPQAKR